ncbi:MAG: LD-carboxypeptidase [Lachnospiraceae bacterium]|nr:LD-carboxypeptidase [Lachnospiraceae bacterium]
MGSKIHPGDKIGIVCCSNGWEKRKEAKVRRLEEILLKMRLVPVFSPYLFEQGSVESGSAAERAQVLMDFYRDDSIKAVFDISGGDIANGILPYLNYEVIADSDKQFWGYSDLTTIINAIYTKTGKSSVLYQICNLLYEHGEQQQESFQNTVFGKGDALFQFPCEFYQGNAMEGIVVGGNIRCFLKLAGTVYFPDLTDKILLLESMSGAVPRMLTYFSQLHQLGAFEQVKGILLGTFTQMEQEKCRPDVWTLLQRFVGPELPVAKTAFVGHGTDSKAVLVGECGSFKENWHT